LAKASMDAVLKRRMTATQQASELQIGDEAYEKLFQPKMSVKQPTIRDIPVGKLVSFFTADIGFHPYPPDRLKAFAAQLAEEGLFERIIVRPIPGSDSYEIIAGENRTRAGRLNGWLTMPAEIIEADDARATSIAIATNLLRRPELTIIERGKAYKALLDAKNRNGQRNAAEETFGDSRQRYNARQIVADFFGVTEYEIRKAIKLANLVPELQVILENSPKQLNLACAQLMADYDEESQGAFAEMCGIEGHRINKSTMQYIAHICPPPRAERQAILSAWREARAKAEQKQLAPPKKISFERKKFALYLDKLGSDSRLEELFLEFLRERVGVRYHADRT
jgi:ParB family chromosome partitioning protein